MDELTIRPRALDELFSEREFDPFGDDSGTLWSVAQIASFSNLKDLAKTRLRIVVPAEDVSASNRTRIERALARYCSHKIQAAGLEMRAWRRGALSRFFWSLAFFAISLGLVAGVQHASWLAEEIRTLITETLVVAGWIILWQPMDDLIEGWVPIRRQDRVYRTIASMPVTVEAAAG
jgi:hypothetical protein